MPSDNFYDKWLEQEPKPAPRPRKAQQPASPPRMMSRRSRSGLKPPASTSQPITVSGSNWALPSRKNTERMAGTTSTVSAASTQATTRPNVTASTTSACGLTAPASPSVPSTSWQRTTESASPFHHYHHSPNP